jgi:predicted RNase H-like HicB family nuclease
MTVRYPIAIEIGAGEAAYGVVVPDLPGGFSAGDTLDEAVAGAEEAAAAWVDATLDAGGAIPARLQSRPHRRIRIVPHGPSVSSAWTPPHGMILSSA